MPIDPELIYCEICQTFVARNQIRRLSIGDADHFLCPGCDDDLLPPVNQDLQYDRWMEEQAKKEYESD